MATSRLEKVGTIFTRTTGLIKSGALKWEDRPIWYDIYKAFPPKEEPRFDRPVPNLKLKQIFYEEDNIRAMFQNNNKRIGAVNLTSSNKTLTQKFIETYRKVEAQYGDKRDIEALYKETIELLNKDREIQAPEDTNPEDVSLSTAFKEAQNRKDKLVGKINIKSFFQD